VNELAHYYVKKTVLTNDEMIKKINNIMKKCELRTIKKNPILFKMGTSLNDQISLPICNRHIIEIKKCDKWRPYSPDSFYVNCMIESTNQTLDINFNRIKSYHENTIQLGQFKPYMLSMEDMNTELLNDIIKNASGSIQKIISLLERNLFNIKLGLNLMDSHLRDSNLRDSNLRDSNFMDSNLRDSNFMDSNLRDSNFMDSNLRDSNFMDSNFMDSNSVDPNFADLNK